MYADQPISLKEKHLIIELTSKISYNSNLNRKIPSKKIQGTFLNEWWIDSPNLQFITSGEQLQKQMDLMFIYSDETEENQKVQNI